MDTEKTVVELLEEIEALRKENEALRAVITEKDDAMHYLQTECETIREDYKATIREVRDIQSDYKEMRAKVRDIMDSYKEEMDRQMARAQEE